MVRFNLLEVEHESKTRVDAGQSLRRHLTDPFLEVVSVDGHQLCDVGHGVLWEPHCLRREKHVAGGVEKARVRRDNDPHNCPNTTPVEGVRLQDQDRMPKTRRRPARFG